MPDRALNEGASTLASRAIVAGALLGATDLAIGAARGHSLFMRAIEWARFAAVSLFGAIAAAALLFAVAAGAEKVARAVFRERASVVLERCAGLVAGAFAAPLLWDLTEGRRIREHVMRAPAVLVGSVVAVVAVTWIVRYARRSPGLRFGVTAALVSVAALAADAFVLPRLYPSFHVGLSLVAIVAAASSVSPIRIREPRVAGSGLLLRTALVLSLPLAAIALLLAASSPNTSFAIRSSAPLTGKALSLAGRSEAEVAVTRAPPATAASGSRGPGLALGDADVLLITVDALRADRLAAYGGEGLTPSMDALAREGMIFARAYTPTPHTSYAVSSLLTGKYLRPVLELAREPTDHPTLPDLLRRYGFRTAAFYPPAIFYVDAERFSVLSERAYGFEYRKEMFADAADRVGQVESYLEGVPEGRPVFVWVHFFEPHEPYEPPAGFARGDSAEARYDGEVAYVDRAIGELVRSFRARRPGATVILTADHGEELGEHGGQFHGTTVYDEQVRVPLVWSSPGFVAPGRSEAPVELVDVATTLLAAVGIPRDARMRGDDLGSVLAGGDGGPSHAFAAVDHERMITDGRLKAICEIRAPSCRLYDLVADPAERANLAEARPEDEARLRAALFAHVGSIPRVEALAMEGETGWPEPLARGALGDVTVVPEIERLLGDSRAEVRAEAARLVAALGGASALPMLVRLSTDDPDPSARAESALARLMLQDAGAAAIVNDLLDEANEPSVDRRRRAALALARRGSAGGAEILAAWAADGDSGEGERIEAIAALASIRHRGSVPSLIALLDEVRLRPSVADALGEIGDPRAGAPLAATLAEERHLTARAAEAEALVALGHPRAARLVRRFLGTEQPLPGGLALLERLGALLPFGRVLSASSDGPSFDCDEDGCRPRSVARLVLPRVPAGSALRLVLSVDGSPGASLRIGGETLALAGGLQEVSVPWSPSREREVDVEANGSVRIVAIAIVPATGEVPGPPPEPVEAGTRG